MKKIIVLLFTLFALSSAKAQYYPIPTHGLGQQLYDLYPSCVYAQDYLTFFLDTTCLEIINEDSLSIYPGDTQLFEDDLRFFVNLKYLKLKGLGLNNVIFPERLREVDFEDSYSTVQIHIGDSLEKIKLTSCHILDLGVLAPTLRELVLQGSVLNELSVVPDSLVRIHMSPFEGEESRMPVSGSFANALNFNDLYYISGGNYRFDANVLGTLPPDVDRILIKTDSISEITALPENLNRLTLLSSNTKRIRLTCEFPQNLAQLRLSGRIDCLPPYPETLDSLVINTLYDFCHPNYLPGIGMSTELCNIPEFNTQDCPAENAISGHIYRDVNWNCVFNEQTDSFLEGIPVDVFDENGNFLQKVYSLEDGLYLFTLPEGSYRIALDTNATGLRKSCPDQEYEYMVTLNSSNPYEEINFELNCDTMTMSELDSIDLGLTNIVRTGNLLFPGVNSVICVNADNFLHNSQLACLSGENLIGADLNLEVKISGPIRLEDTLSWMQSVTSSNDTLVIDCLYQPVFNYTGNSFCFPIRIDTSAQSGDNVCVKALLTVSIPETNLSNNYRETCFQVVNSYDPNMKETYPTEVGYGFNDEIRYTIHFQNTGTAPAMNIKLVDTLDQKLDAATFRVIDASHAVIPELNGHNLRFKFMAINLADSLSDPEGSKGYVEYAIYPSDPMVSGDVIHNTAYIYFDYNEPIITNTTENTCVTPLEIVNPLLPESKLLVYPNPLGVDRLLKIKKADKEEMTLRIFDLHGTEVLQVNLSNSQSIIDLKELNAGVYILKSESASGIYSGKLVVF